MKTPKYDAWRWADTQASEAERLVTGAGIRTRKASTALMPSPTELARAAELRQRATALFEEAMAEMECAVENVLSKTHSRLV